MAPLADPPPKSNQVACPGRNPAAAPAAQKLRLEGRVAKTSNASMDVAAGSKADAFLQALQSKAFRVVSCYQHWLVLVVLKYHLCCFGPCSHSQAVLLSSFGGLEHNAGSWHGKLTACGTATTQGRGQAAKVHDTFSMVTV